MASLIKMNCLIWKTQRELMETYLLVASKINPIKTQISKFISITLEVSDGHARTPEVSAL